MSRLRTALAFAAFLVVALSPPASAAGKGISADVSDRDMGVWARVQQGVDDLGRTPRQIEQVDNPHSYTRVFACDGNSPVTGRDGGCQAALDACPGDEVLYWLYRAPADTSVGQLGWVQYDSRCLAPTDPTGTNALPGMTLEDFQRLPLPAGTANVQPPNGYTLINIETNVYAQAEPTTLDTELLGIPVQVRATPSRYAWDFGDGNHFGPHADPGDPYPALRITNTYTERGTYNITLTTHYTGEYSVAGGPWLPIPGEAQVTSPPITVQALAGRNALVADTLP